VSISQKTHKRLWGLAASKCSFENCKKDLSLNTKDASDHYTIGDEAHIISGSNDGPRFDSNFPLGDIDKYENLVLLCKIHHTEIDRDVKFYTPEKVREIKRLHEMWVKNNLEIDTKAILEDELLMDFIESIEFLAGFDNWTEWTECLLGGHFTNMPKTQFNNLITLHKYLNGRPYPDSRKELVNAINQFNEILEDFINHFSLFKGESSMKKDFFFTLQLYRENTISVERQNIHEYMIEELIYELTKAANFLCSQVRASIHPTYRMERGILLLHDCPAAGIAFLRLHYHKDEKYLGKNEIREKVKKALKLN